ncbi:furry homolog-like protein [Tanacetum coccineum]
MAIACNGDAVEFDVGLGSGVDCGYSGDGVGSGDDHKYNNPHDHSVVSSDFQRMDATGSGSSSGGKVTTFEGVHPLILKGLVSTASHDISIAVLSRLTIPSCDSIFGDPDTHFLMHIMGVLL